MGGRARESFYELIKGLQGNYDITRSLTIPRREGSEAGYPLERMTGASPGPVKIAQVYCLFFLLSTRSEASLLSL
jgi:hypothetical protein